MAGDRRPPERPAAPPVWQRTPVATGFSASSSAPAPRSGGPEAGARRTRAVAVVLPVLLCPLLLLLTGCGEPQLVLGSGTIGANTRAEHVLLRNVLVEPPPEWHYDAGADVLVRLVLFNESDRPEALTGARSAIAEQALIQWDTACDGKPEQVPRLPIRPEGTVPAVAGQGTGWPAYRVALRGLTRRVPAGSTVPVTLTFERAGEVTVEAIVRPRSDRVELPPAPCPPTSGDEHGR